MTDFQWMNVHSNSKLGRIAEHYAQALFLYHGYDVFPTDVDDSGVDFIARDSKGNTYDVQVKSARNDNYQYIRESKFNKSDSFLVCCVRFGESGNPEVYIFPGTAWDEEGSVLKYYEYGSGKKSKPEYGISFGTGDDKMKFVERYHSDHFFNHDMG